MPEEIDRLSLNAEKLTLDPRQRPSAAKAGIQSKGVIAALKHGATPKSVE